MVDNHLKTQQKSSAMRLTMFSAHIPTDLFFFS